MTQMTTGMAQYPVSNMAMVEKTVTSGMAWRPVSHRVSQSLTFSKHPVYPKKVFSNLKLVGLINYLNIAHVLSWPE